MKEPPFPSNFLLRWIRFLQILLLISISSQKRRQRWKGSKKIKAWPEFFPRSQKFIPPSEFQLNSNPIWIQVTNVVKYRNNFVTTRIPVVTNVRKEKRILSSVAYHNQDHPMSITMWTVLWTALQWTPPSWTTSNPMCPSTLSFDTQWMRWDVWPYPRKMRQPISLLKLNGNHNSISFHLSDFQYEKWENFPKFSYLLDVCQSQISCEIVTRKLFGKALRNPFQNLWDEYI